MPATKPTRPLTCHGCGSFGDILTVAGAGNTRVVKGKKRRTQHVRCRACGNEWNSTHPDALRLGREADKAAKAGAA